MSFSHTRAASVLAADGTVTVIGPAASERRRLSVGPHGEGLAAALSPDGRRLLVLRIVDQRQDVELWDLATSSRRWSVREPARAVTWAARPDGSAVAILRDDGAVVPRELSSGREIGSLPKRQYLEEPDGWPCGDAQLWELPAMRRLGDAANMGSAPLERLYFDESGVERLVLVSAGGTVREINLAPEALARRVCARVANWLTPAAWASLTSDRAYHGKDACAG
ncbi:hypothetical protein ACWEPC_19890 [Nonomuraea sp. NPDC004297]